MFTDNKQLISYDSYNVKIDSTMMKFYDHCFYSHYIVITCYDALKRKIDDIINMKNSFLFANLFYHDFNGNFVASNSIQKTYTNVSFYFKNDVYALNSALSSGYSMMTLSKKLYENSFDYNVEIKYYNYSKYALNLTIE